MSEAKHTPGPWFCTATGESYAHVSTHPDEYGNIATFWSGMGKNAHANARVAAAAPELLEAVRELLATHPAAYRDPNPIDNRTDNAVRIGCAAIAKATGEANG